MGRAEWGDSQRAKGELPVEGRARVIIEHVAPEIDCGRFPIKRVLEERVVVTADIFADGHDALSAALLYRHEEEREWQTTPMRLLVNDRWQGEFTVTRLGNYFYTLEAWVDRFQTWQKDFRKKWEAGQDLQVETEIGIGHIRKALAGVSGEEGDALAGYLKILEGGKEGSAFYSAAVSGELLEIMVRYGEKRFASIYPKELAVVVDRERARFSSWYELFPRSCSGDPGSHGTFKDCETLLPEIARMGFDILYLAPLHPIGRTSRKGKNNSLEARPEDVGSPWAIGSEEGGHKSVHPQLGDLQDFTRFVNKAGEFGMETAVDLAFQCSPDHPWVKEHPRWFRWRPDGTLQYAENPPKKYEDIVPLDFETEDWAALWEELKSVVLFWAGRGIRIFRVDNPHTKPFAFWNWLIREVKRIHPDVIFLAEAFTRPKVMYHLAKVGFTQSYTYFTWRNTKRELTEYLRELTGTDVREYFRPNFWPNTPDILSEYLQYGGRPAFVIRLVLAATLSSNYGIYGPAFELTLAESFPGREEYRDSEKYEIGRWDREREGNLRDFISRMNRIRRENPSLQGRGDLRFLEVENDSLLAYARTTEDLSNVILAVVNLDPYHPQSGWIRIPLADWGLETAQPYMVHDLLSDEKYIWQGEKNFVQLDPGILPANLFQVKKRVRREVDFDYFM